jgi:hypothetical protein
MNQSVSFSSFILLNSSFQILPWPSGDGTSFTRRRSQVRVLPGVLRQPLRSGLEPGSQHGLIRRPTPVQIRPPQLALLEVRRAKYKVRKKDRELFFLLSYFALRTSYFRRSAEYANPVKRRA